MIIYIDTDYKCHVTDDGTMRAVETDYFNGKCPEYIEGFRIVPEGETWTRSDGVKFNGEMIAAWKDYALLQAAQKEYEAQEIERLRAELADATAALELLGVTPDE